MSPHTAIRLLVVHACAWPGRVCPAARTDRARRSHAGSIIFSQSVLAIRSGVRSRLQGLTLATAQLAMFALPFSLVHYLPNFYYGALLAVLGIDICREWLWNTRTRITLAEFILSWLSFSATITLTSLMPVQVPPPSPRTAPGSNAADDADLSSWYYAIGVVLCRRRFPSRFFQC